jgi:cytochrome c-type biogenesis protein CcmH
MIGFAVFAALLAAFALRLLLAPLLRALPPAAVADERTGNLRVLREQRALIDADLAAGAIDADQHRRARADLERRVLEEEGAVESAPATRTGARRTAWAIALALPAFALAVYLWLGTPQAVRTPASTTPAAEHGPSAQEVDAMVARLAERLKANPDDGEGWAMLARSYAALERFPQATEAYAKAAALQPADAALLADYADALAMTQGQTLAGEPTRLIERALRADPQHLKALALAGSAAMERRDFAAAIGYWQRALQQVPPGSEQAQAIERSLAAAQAGARAAGPSPAASAAAATLSGRVRLSQQLAAQVQPGDTLFVFARAAEGPRAPLAILRRSAAELPLAFTLDDSQAMSPQTRLSQHEQVQLVARISRSGQATPQSGDLQGQTQKPVRVGSAGIELVIDSVVP